MKRYNCYSLIKDEYERGAILKEEINGKWVKWEKVSILIEIAKKGLEFYAKIVNYNDNYENNIYHLSDIDNDCGKIAREALERMKAMENE